MLPFLSKTQIDFFQENGYLTIEDYASEEDIQILKKKAYEIVEAFEPKELKIFTTDDQSQYLDQYFLKSANNISCFFEEEALDKDGVLQVDKQASINKIGHALHDLEDCFKRFSYRPELLSIAQSLGMQKAGIVQSQYIYKQARIGAKVNPHTDSTFIHSSPLSCLGAWVALEDAAIENGCLSFIPASHRRYPLQEQYVRNAKDTGTEFVSTNKERVNWDLEQLTPIEVKKGTLVLIHGEVVHASYVNRSNRSRQSYIVHLIDLACEWSPQNWLQRPPNFPFRAMESVIMELNS